MGLNMLVVVYESLLVYLFGVTNVREPEWMLFAR